MPRERDKLLTALTDAERERQVAADELADADTALRAAVQALRAAQGAVSEAREGRARTEARLEGARTRRQDESRRIRETLDIAPEGCLALAEVQPGAALPPLLDVDRKVASLKADRERLGGVNLRADDELQALSIQVGRPRDREGGRRARHRQAARRHRPAEPRGEEAPRGGLRHRQRALRQLFTTLFGGGEARLEMIEGEDPLEGGLEIIAKPPGKKPATLSLLSGGEQSLTAMSLIFAVFLTNPSPICVLDEVDAPLDDANVDRFCRFWKTWRRRRRRGSSSSPTIR